MAYQVLARKWRPQRFEDVIGQQGVTQTLRNAIAAGRVAHSFVFSGPRGVGKTSTARILARGLNCEHGPTAEPCGVCDACIEIAQGRDIDVLEIDAATNTGVDKVREVIIAGLSTVPVRDRTKIFIIDEVHRLSQNAFDALLKSVEEPPPHVVFMMATTELEKVPATIQSRSQVFELKALGLKQINDQLREIVGKERIEIDDGALMLVARAGDGSMRDALSALDQVIAFAGATIDVESVSTVLGLVRRELLFDMADAVVREDGSAAFELSARAVESGYDLRAVLRELARLTRDVLLVNIDPARVNDLEVAAESERERLGALARAFSVEDLMRAFDVLTKAEYDIRGSAHPRYHVEMALLRWIHLRKLVPISDLIQGLERGSPESPRAARPAPPPPRPASASAAVKAVLGHANGAGIAGAPASERAGGTGGAKPPGSRVEAKREAAKPARSAPPVDDVPAPPKAAAPAGLKDAFLEALRTKKKVLYGTAVAQAQQIDVQPDRIVFTYTPQQKIMRNQLDKTRPELEALASELAGRPVTVVSVEVAGTAPVKGASATEPTAQDKQAELRQRALADSGVQAMLDVFAAEIKDVEEI